jgi:hypothetical protein
MRIEYGIGDLSTIYEWMIGFGKSIVDSACNMG